VAFQPTASPTNESVVVTGFEPFGGRRVNRSWEAVKQLEAPPSWEKRLLAVDYRQIAGEIARLAKQKPACLLLVGESPGHRLAVEQVALNLADTSRADNSQSPPHRETLLDDNPLALRASWDARVVAKRITAAGIPAAASYHAGTYCCNASLYLAIASLAAHTAVGFLHVPARRWPRGIRLTKLATAIEICIDSLATISRNSSEQQLDPSVYEG
jgi:pyroglutamyl-peptidase